jgi:menaquinone-dependent protoporphyrinogen oxidase
MKVLVTAASKHGSTADIASAITRVLHLRGVEADEQDPESVHDLTPYDVVVLGSGVYAGRWLPAARSLIDRCDRQFPGRRVYLFSSGPLGTPPVPADEPDMSRSVARTGAVEHRVFAGRLDKRDLGRLERTMVRAVRAPEGDYRDWEAVTEWATEIADSVHAVAG